MIPIMLGAIASAQAGDAGKVSQALSALPECLDELAVLLHQMYEKCSPNVFCNEIRPWLAGSKNATAAGLPKGFSMMRGKVEVHGFRLAAQATHRVRSYHSLTLCLAWSIMPRDSL